MGEPREKTDLDRQSAETSSRFAEMIKKGEEEGEFGKGQGDEPKPEDAFGERSEITAAEEPILKKTKKIAEKLQLEKSQIELRQKLSKTSKPAKLMERIKKAKDEKQVPVSSGD
jgi:hypothetical protein